MRGSLDERNWVNLFLMASLFSEVGEARPSPKMRGPYGIIEEKQGMFARHTALCMCTCSVSHGKLKH